MNRRNFTKATVLAGMGISKSSLLLNNNVIKTGYKYNLHYAPHIGMFKNHAGNDPIDQLNFMADLGFTAFEDNDIRMRDISLQEKMSSTMIKEV